MTVSTEIKTMFENAVHIGHRTQKWNPKMKKFIYGEKDGIHVIDLERTSECLESALNFMGKLFAEGKTVLFVSTKPQSARLLEDAAKQCHMPYVSLKWIPGLLTNFGTIKTRTKYLGELKRQETTGEFDKYTKKEASGLKKEIAKLQIALGGVESMKAMPDAVFVIDTAGNSIVVKEARRMKVPIVGIVDTNADPSLVDYPIPANDDALKSLTYLLEKVCDVARKSGKIQE